MKKLPILVELYIIMFIVLVIPLISVIRYNNYTLLKYSEFEIASSASMNLGSVQTLNETILQNIKIEMLTLAKSSDIENVSTIKYLSSELKNGDNYLKILNVEKQLYQMGYSSNKIYSIYVYIKDADYVITNKGVSKLNILPDSNFLYEYNDKDEISLETCVTRVIPTANEDVSINAISYIYPLTSLVTTARGFIVVNLYEDKFKELINTSSLDKNGDTFIINQDGTVVIHGNNAKFMDNLSNNNSIQEIIQSHEQSGTIVAPNDSDKSLYAFSKDTTRDWIYISCYSLKSLLGNINDINRSSFIFLIVIIGVGILITFFVMIRISKPMNALVKLLKDRADLSLGNTKNEMLLVTTAFQQIAQQEKELNEIIKKKEDDTKELFINDLLKGNISKYHETDTNLQNVFPYPNFIVLVASIDHTETFISKFTPEKRYYYKMMILTKFREIFNQAFIAKGTLYDKQTIVLIINIRDYDSSNTPKTFKNLSEQLQYEIKKEIKISISIGLGGIHNGYTGIKVSLSEAEEALKQKLLTGNESILFWKEQAIETIKYFYPYNREKHILNCLYTRNMESLYEEIRLTVQDIRNTEGISYDNTIQIFNQLLSTTIKYLVENSINIRDIFGNIYVVYRKMSAMDTIEDMENYLISFYQKIEIYFNAHVANDEKKHIDKILEYLKSNYKKEINFEDMATNIGISYSYIRKIIKDVTDKNLIDYINLLRIEEAKKLICQTSMSITDISLSVGYNNVRNFIRFFKKYEGITPKEFRDIK